MRDILAELEAKGVDAKTITRITEALEAQEALLARREHDRQRLKRYRNVSGNVSSNSKQKQQPRNVTRAILDLERKKNGESILNGEKKDGTREENFPDPKTDYYRRGYEFLPKSSGGLLTLVLEAKHGNVPLARSALETASTKANPAAYLGAIAKGANGKRGLQLIRDFIP
jgi:hypothetical protein